MKEELSRMYVLGRVIVEIVKIAGSTIVFLHKLKQYVTCVDV